MAKHEYKTLIYALEGKYTYSLRYWWDNSAQKAYGEKERARFIGAIPTQMKQLEQALTELDQDGWELVAYNTYMAFPWTLHGSAVLRRPLP